MVSTVSDRLIVVILVHPLKASLPIYVTDFGILTAVRLSHLRNAPFSNLCSPACKVTVFSDLQSENTYQSKTFTPWGMSTEVRFLQYSKAHRPMVVTDLGMFIDLNLQHSNASSPMDFSVDGSVTDVIVVSGYAISSLMLNALFPIVVTPSGITTPSKEQHLAKAELPMDFKDGGRVIDFILGQ